MDDWFTPLPRFAHYALLLGLFGITAFRLIGLRRFNDLPDLRRPLLIAALAAPVATVGLMLASIAAMMGQPILSLEWATIDAMLFATDMGWAFLARLALLVAALAAVLSSRPATSIAALCYALALATLPWGGHAAATEGGIGLVHRLNDALHLLAAGLWIGAIESFLYLAVRAHRVPQGVNPASLLDAMHRFAPLGLFLAGTVAGTGAINAELIFGLRSTIQVAQDGYGQMLLLKIALVGLMIGCAALNAQRARRWARSTVGETDLLKAIRISLAAELVLAALVIASVAILGMLMPVE